jgi:D-3-phosphoglycerate dehydrogenase
MGDANLEREILASADIKLLTASGTDEETLISEGMHCDGIMVEYAEITSRILDAWGQGGKVKVVGRQGIGFNNIDVEAATRNNIMVTNVPDYCLDEVAEHTMALALNVLREIKSFDRRVVKGDFEERSIRPIYRLKGRNFCVYGFGNIARRVVHRAQAFGFNTYAFDPFVSEEEAEKHNTVKLHSLEELAATADVFSLHVPLLEGTRHSINRDIFNLMKKSCVVINTARGGLIREADLIEALKTEKLRGQVWMFLNRNRLILTIPC